MSKKEENNNELQDSPDKQMQVNINIEKQPVLYTDGVLITSDPNNFGVVFNFTQHTAGQVHVVSRVGMSREHAHNFLETLNNHLGK
jgi:hypothetical protein